MSDLDGLYRINDVLTSLASEFQVAFGSEADEDQCLDELTHIVAERFRVGPYRIGIARSADGRRMSGRHDGAEQGVEDVPSR